MSGTDFLARVSALLERYLLEDRAPDQHLAVLRWQIAEGHALENRDTYPGHVTTSALIVSPDLRQTLLIDHRTLKRWLQPGGHYEPAELFWHSAMREAVEETAVAGLALHAWHGSDDRPFLIDSHEVPGKASRNEKPHLHHDLQFLFVADPTSALEAQIEEVAAAQWHPIEWLADVSPNAWRKIGTL